ncbi:hypothetical protein GAYE_SCF39G5314 [Galdieria yellowstonensis]|uniref:Uncharacterized protein n=1 Tax=Galdieria yellowstonensis TaxID=3028027 RepID=A0AAV9IIX3_9RHOD|nr:hypothetical protein GAYE_SCF39G5314 [Galdieria yellowstonensis]
MPYCNFISPFVAKETFRAQHAPGSSLFVSNCCSYRLRSNRFASFSDSRVRRLGLSVYMGKVSDFGPFTPIVYVTRWVLGKDRFNRIRGKAIALHSQVITEFCKYVGMDPKLRQALIRLAKTNGSKLGFLS